MSLVRETPVNAIARHAEATDEFFLSKHMAIDESLTPPITGKNWPKAKFPVYSFYPILGL